MGARTEAHAVCAARPAHLQSNSHQQQVVNVQPPCATQSRASRVRSAAVCEA
jgi:hypothetical protein